MGITDYSEGIKNTERAGGIILFGLVFRRGGSIGKRIMKGEGGIPIRDG